MWFLFAACAALCFGIRGILYQWTSQRPVDRNLLFVGVYLSGALISVLLNVRAGQPWNGGIVFGVLMGLFSFAANASLYKGYEVGRASVVAFFSGLTPIVVVLAAYLLWRETLGSVQLLGFCIVVLALIVVRYRSDLQSGQLSGWQWGLLAMLLYGFTDLSSKQSVLSGGSMFPVLTMMFATGTLLFFLMYAAGRMRTRSAAAGPSYSQDIPIAASPERETPGTNVPNGENASSARPAVWSGKRTLLWGMTVGLTNIVGMVLMLSAYEDGITGIVSAIAALNVVIVLLYARFYLKDAMSRQETIGIVLAMAGILVLRLAS
ncbi:DMT family transporter [Saccharibacillus alkalitolerans]|uniref:DMT family transporter n=1 Tax=Saccharibacillus alkalitolerans TaxID=2705290 RepID=A0ABX0F441_9BACL|nr:DMT family transporter [Saccharibacillus alkalitolerans]NGZ74674.1 DMT family transporter [Saccharibacillus alkalitolerans]